MAKRYLDSSLLCPECEGALQLSGNLRIGQKILCRRCGTLLIILAQKPLELGVANDKPQGNRQAAGDKNLKKGTGVGPLPFKRMVDSTDSTSIVLSDGASVECPSCSAPLHFAQTLKVSQFVACPGPDCDEMFAVVSLRPLELVSVAEDAWSSTKIQRRVNN